MNNRPSQKHGTKPNAEAHTKWRSPSDLLTETFKAKVLNPEVATSRRLLTLQFPHPLRVLTAPSSLCPARSDTSTMRGIRSQMRFGKRSAYCKKDSRACGAGIANSTRLRQDEIQQRRSHGKDI